MIKYRCLDLLVFINDIFSTASNLWGREVNYSKFPHVSSTDAKKKLLKSPVSPAERCFSGEQNSSPLDTKYCERRGEGIFPLWQRSPPLQQCPANVWHR